MDDAARLSQIQFATGVSGALQKLKGRHDRSLQITTKEGVTLDSHQGEDAEADNAYVAYTF